MSLTEFKESSRGGRRGASRRTIQAAAGVDSFPHLPTMDGNRFIDLEAQSYSLATNLEYRDFEQALEAGGASDDYGFLALSR
jgi:hypothetical protein